MLEPLELTWIIRNESLEITTPEQAESLLETRIYPVRDLVLLEFQRTVDADFDSLIDMITSTIAADSWDEVGGPGAIEANWNSLSLVISQTWSTHRRIEPLLTTLRTARDLQGIVPVQTGAIRTFAARPPRQYRATANSAWQRPRMYEE